ncbi:MAG: CsiV family protein [Wenzhouxiangella sp.]
MKTATLCILLVLLAGPTIGWPETEPLVRVEVIVFEHLDGVSDRWPGNAEDPFADLIDPQERARLAVWTARPATALPAAVQTPGSSNPDRSGDPAEFDPTGAASPDDPASAASETPIRVRSEHATGPRWPDVYLDLAALSPTVAQARRRLEASQGHRVLTSMAWLQPLERGRETLPVRVRGTEALDIDWTRTRPTGISAESPIQPPAALPVIRFALDGSVRVRQRQFRHVDLDLEWREASPTPDSTAEPGQEEVIHRLTLSRPIDLDRLEYFDSPWLGVLVHVQEWVRPEPASSAAQAPVRP